MKKTKFDSLVKLKKLKVREIENKILKLNSTLQKEIENLKKIENQLLKLEYPKEGSFSLIIQFKTIQNYYLKEIKLKKSQIDFIKHQLSNLENSLKEANLELEKMLYLQGEEIKKIVNRIKKGEAKNLDEIALLLFERKKGLE